MLTPVPTAGALSFKLPAPKAGSIVIAQVRGKSSAPLPPRLTLTNRRALGRTIVASATWHQRRGSGYDGVVVLVNPPARSGPYGPLRSAAGGAAFSTSGVLSVAHSAIISTLVGILAPQVQQARQEAARAQCANNVNQIGPVLHQYHDNAMRGVPAGSFLRFACGVAMDQTLTGAPQFWNRIGMSYCGFFIKPAGSKKLGFNGSCNRRVQQIDVYPPTSLAVTGCAAPGKVDCGYQAHHAFFSPSSAFPSFTGISGLQVSVSRATAPSFWGGTAEAPGGNPFGFPFDPTTGQPHFPF